MAAAIIQVRGDGGLVRGGGDGGGDKRSDAGCIVKVKPTG